MILNYAKHIKNYQVMKETGNRGFQIMKMLMLCKTSFSCSEADMTTVENAVLLRNGEAVL